ncbi:MAG: zinc-ribbon domain-containing protein [Rubrivivax sp.]|nr:zinc-ribbon domain-containing protein [Rubrivivax sp.]
MTLATRCSACGTSFRIVQDQLKVSGGWVRCGRCNEVFNALEGLYEIYTQPGELGTSTARPGGHVTPPPEPAGPASDTWNRPPQTPGASAPVRSTANEAMGAAISGAYGPADPPETQGFAAGPDDPAALQQRFGEAIEPGLQRPASAGSAGPQAPPFDDVETRLEPRPGEEGAAAPSFLLEGEEAMRRKTGLSRGQRWAWGLLGAALVVLLAAQGALAWRDTLALKLPAAKPALVEACSLLACRVEPLRRMAALSVDGSNLRQRNTEGSYELLVNLRNRGDLALMLPAFELTLTDTQGQALVRRVLLGSDLGARTETIASGAELSLAGVLEISDRRIAGYTVEIFYP